MNQQKIYFLLIIVLIFANACDSALEENPVTFYSEETVFSTEEGVETAINGIYAAQNQGDYYGTAWHNLIMPVSGKFFSTQIANRDATGLNTTPSNVSLGQLWEGMYQTINTANTTINNLENTLLDLSNKETAFGTAYLIRGATYFDLVRLFGGVPLRTKPTQLEDIHLPRSSRQAVIDLVIADLENAKTMLPDEAVVGRPSKWAANVYLAKLYMQLAGEDGGNASLWTNAKAELMPVINSGAYSLTPTFSELFEAGNENTTESIFELQYGQTGGQRNSDMPRLYTPGKSFFAPVNVTTFGRLRPNKETFDAHVIQYPDDPRIAATYVFDEYEKNTGGIQKIYPEKDNGKQGFAVVRKWFDPTYNGTTTNRNYILLRYADVLLMMAEIENELTGPDAAYEFVNEVLTRARDLDGDGVEDTIEPANFENMSQDEFRIRVLKERQYELICEGHAWFDTRRRGYDYFLNEVVVSHNTHPTFDPTTDFEYPTSEKNMLLPIPLLEISGNQAISANDQNSGY